MNFSFPKAIVFCLAVPFSVSAQTHQSKPFFYGTLSETVVHGLDNSLDSYWSLCVDQSGSVLWNVDGAIVNGRVESYENDILCVEHEIRMECFNFEPIYKGSELTGMTLSTNKNVRNFSVIQNNISQCELDYVS